MMKSIEGEEGDSGANGVAEEYQETSPEEKQEAQSFVQTEEKRCDHDQDTAATSEPSATSSVGHTDVTSVDPEKLFKMLADSQSRRMDDQRVSPSLLPGLQIFSSRGSAVMNQWDTDQLCNIVVRAQSSRMEDQRCAPPQIILTPDTPASLRKSSTRPASPTQDPDTLIRPPSRSASLSPVSDKEKMPTDNNTSAQTLSPAEQERLMTVVCKALRGRMEDQRCYLDPSMRTPPPQGIPIPQGMDTEPFFKLVTKIQSQRLDDQRVALSFLPGTQTPSGGAPTPLVPQDTEKLFNVVSRVQASLDVHCSLKFGDTLLYLKISGGYFIFGSLSQRMDEQRCYAPHIQLGTPSQPRKVCTDPASPIQDHHKPESSRQFSRRSSAVISPPSETHEHQAQRWLEEQQRVISPAALSKKQFFSLVANSQSKRMDDQRAEMPPAQTKKPFIPQIILTPESPAAPKRASSRPTSLTQEPDSLTRPPPRSASFSPVSDKERMQYDNAIASKLTFQVSVCLTAPKQGDITDNQKGSYPDVFLKIGPPGGESFVLPLTPMVCEPISLGMTPRSRRHHSRSSSPHRAHTRTTQPRPSSPNPSPQPCPISPDEDYFSLIQKVHTAQLQQGSATEKSREAGKGRGKGDGRRERNDRVKRK
ncbi:hypothetical protein MHYP_G00304910 [Metynnis hypsauchen]